MKHSTQRWDRVTGWLELTAAGLGVTPSAAPTCAVQRIADAQWLNVGNTAFDQASPVYRSMNALAGTTGVYSYGLGVAAMVDPGVDSDAQMGYLYIMKEAGLYVLEHTIVHATNSAWDELRADHADVGSFGEYVNTDHSPATTAAAVWNLDISAYGAGDQKFAGARLWTQGTLVGLEEGTDDSPRHLCSDSDATTGHFYGATVPTPTGDTPKAYNGRCAVLHIGTPGATRSYPCIINSVATDGTGDYFQLETEDGSGWSLPIVAAQDELVVLNRLSDQGAVTPADVWGEAMATYAVDGTFGNAFRRMLSIRQENMRVVYTAWNAANVPTNGTIYIYPSKSAMDADTGGTGVGSFGSYTFAADFTDLKPTEYTSGKLT